MARLRGSALLLLLLGGAPRHGSYAVAATSDGASSASSSAAAPPLPPSRFTYAACGDALLLAAERGARLDLDACASSAASAAAGAPPVAVWRAAARTDAAEGASAQQQQQQHDDDDGSERAAACVFNLTHLHALKEQLALAIDASTAAAAAASAVSSGDAEAATTCRSAAAACAAGKGPHAPPPVSSHGLPPSPPRRATSSSSSVEADALLAADFGAGLASARSTLGPLGAYVDDAAALIWLYTGLDVVVFLRPWGESTCRELSMWVRLAIGLLVAGGAAAASSSAHWATVQELPSLTPLRDDLLARVGRGTPWDLHVMHGVCIGGTFAVWFASLYWRYAETERALMQWMLAYAACLLLRALCVRTTILPDPSGPERAVAKSAILAAMTHPSATRHDMMPSGHMLVVGVTAVLVPIARTHWLAAAAWVAVSAAATLVSRTHYTCDIVIGAAVGALMGHAALTSTFAHLPCAPGT